MVRWQPDARGRLELAAMQLYLERGFDQTTVEDIAERAGLTKRTFFRYFTDKREVLFSGAGDLQERFVSAVAGAPASASPMDAMAVALEAVGPVFAGRREFATQRYAVVSANPALQERELSKLATMSAALADALRARGVRDPAAGLVAETGVAIFKIAFQRWVTSTGRRSFAHYLRESLDGLTAATAGRSTAD